MLFNNVLYFAVHAFGSLNFYLEHSKFTDLLNSIRSKCESCATWPDPAKAIKASLVRLTGLLVGRRKKVKFRRIFRDKFAEKMADFAGIFEASFAENDW